MPVAGDGIFRVDSNLGDKIYFSVHQPLTGSNTAAEAYVSELGAIVDIDLRGTYNVTKAAFEAWLKEHGGHIVNISAPFEGMGVALQAHVAAAKTGVDSLTRSCAVEFGPYGVRVNGVAPGATSGTEGMARLEATVPSAGDPGASCPLGYVGAKSDIANAVLFLVSDAASYITGEIVEVDGGLNTPESVSASIGRTDEDSAAEGTAGPA